MNLIIGSFLKLVHIFCTIDVMAPTPYNHVTIYGISQLIENRSIIILLIEEGLYVRNREINKTI